MCIRDSRPPSPPRIQVFSKFRTLTGAAVLVSLSSCTSLASSLLPAGLGDVLGNVTGLTSKIGDWKSGLGAALDGTQLGALKGFVESAGQMGDKLGGFSDLVTEAARDPLATIGSKLGDLGNFDVSSLQNLPGADQLGRVNEFADSAADLGSLTTDFLSQFGS